MKSSTSRPVPCDTPVYGAPPPPRLVIDCQYCGRPLVPTKLLRWSDGTPMAWDAYRCGQTCTGLEAMRQLETTVELT